MSIEDKVIKVAVRRVRSVMWLDITCVNVRVTRGVVYLTGHLQRMTASHSDFSEPTLRELDARDVKYRLSNWRRKPQGRVVARFEQYHR